MNPAVLVYGSGTAGCITALKLAGAGFKVDVIRTGDAAPAPGCLGESTGNPRFFEHLMLAAGQERNIAFRSPPASLHVNENYPGFTAGTEYNALVFAPDAGEPGCSERGALNLTTAYRLLPGLAKRRGWTVFLLDHNNITHTGVMRDVLLLAREIKTRHTGEVQILLKNVQVTPADEQELYDECREQCVLFTKYREGLTVTNTCGDFTLQGCDEQAGHNFTIEKPALLIIPANPVLTADSTAFAAGLGLRITAGIPAQPYGTNRPGIFAAGAACGSLTLEAIRAEAGSILAGISLFVDKKAAVESRQAAFVEKEKCAYCLTCVRVCPIKAAITDRAEQKAKIISWICRGCGICAADCPACAILLKDRVAV